ncbi:MULTISPECIES: PucR family transcriptional regulator [unclassified Mycolicibacterium]|uniref:PucR family transcriptional regulator n=1 Tax=unclassified Mycolicibacterium TaxID=2636767 RepID=UPI002ED8BAF3
MEPSRAGDARGQGDRRLWGTVVQKTAIELAERVCEISESVVGHVAERLPDLLNSPEAVAANRASTEASIRDFAESLLSGAEPVELPGATAVYAVESMRRGIPLTTLMRSYRIAHAATAQHVTAILTRHAVSAEELNRAGELCSEAMFGYVDTALCLAEQLYTAERERWLRSAAASQAEAIDAILSGKLVDVDVANRRLGRDLRRVHIAAIAWRTVAEDGRDSLAMLESAVRDVAEAVGSPHPLVQPRGTSSIAAWISTTTEVPTGVLDQVRFRSALAPGVRVAIGEPGRGLAGFRESHSEALDAERMARLLCRDEGTITRFNDIALHSLATTDLERARRFVQRELGPLTAADETTRRLTTTLRTYLDESGNRGRTARRLHVHENTVAYRLHRAEALLGRSLDTRTLELRLALVLAEAVLPSP